MVLLYIVILYDIFYENINVFKNHIINNSHNETI